MFLIIAAAIQKTKNLYITGHHNESRSAGWTKPAHLSQKRSDNIAKALFASADILTLISVGFFGTLLVFVALEMGQHSVKTTSLPLTILVGVIALLVSMTVAFMIGIVVAYVMQRAQANGKVA